MTDHAGMLMAMFVGVLLVACGPGASSRGATGERPDSGGGAGDEVVTGCYTAELGAWTPEHQPSPHQLPPAVFELREEIGERMLERGKTLVRPVADAADERYAYWTRPAPDSLMLTWTTGYEGLRLRLAHDAAENRWSGLATAFTDVVIEGRPRPSAPVRVNRVTCP